MPDIRDVPCAVCGRPIVVEITFETTHATRMVATRTVRHIPPMRPECVDSLTALAVGN